MKRFVLHIVILYGLGVAVGETGVLVITGVPTGDGVPVGAGELVGAGVLVGRTLGVGVWTPSIEKIRPTISPNVPRTPRSCWLKKTCKPAPFPVSNSILSFPGNEYALPGITLPS
jgi:hypothetical protein